MAVRRAIFAVPIVLTLILAPLSSAAPLNATDTSSTNANSCVWEFSPTICGEDISYEELVYPQTTSCIPLATPMKNVWTNECSNWFSACTMWIQPDCTGEWSLRIEDVSNTHLGTCFSGPYYISAVSCEAA